jgi:hypothetical protein
LALKPVREVVTVRSALGRLGRFGAAGFFVIAVLEDDAAREGLEGRACREDDKEAEVDGAGEAGLVAGVEARPFAFDLLEVVADCEDAAAD